MITLVLRRLGSVLLVMLIVAGLSGDALKQLTALSTTELLATRYERLMSYGRFKEQAVN